MENTEKPGRKIVLHYRRRGVKNLTIEMDPNYCPSDPESSRSSCSVDFSSFEVKYQKAGISKTTLGLGTSKSTVPTHCHITCGVGTNKYLQFRDRSIQILYMPMFC